MGTCSCTHARMHTSTHAHTHMRTHPHTHTRARAHLHTRTRTHAQLQSRPSSLRSPLPASPPTGEQQQRQRQRDSGRCSQGQPPGHGDGRPGDVREGEDPGEDWGRATGFDCVRRVGAGMVRANVHATLAKAKVQVRGGRGQQSGST